MTRARSIAVVVAALGLVGAATYAAYTRDLARVRARLVAGSQLAPTSHGPVEYALAGKGPTALVLHGAGGGYDHGLLVARAYGGDGFRWISPSRFGYLRSPLPADASTAAQADALVELLDHLGVGRVPILAASGGVPPALQLAARHPDRCAALVLVSSAPYTPLTAAEQELPMPIAVYDALFASDLPFWVLQNVAPSRVAALFDVRPELRADLTAEEARVVDALVDGFQPVTWRVDGLANEAAAVDPAAADPLPDVRCPTLVVHARDDGINLFRYGEHTAANIGGAELVAFDTGGHLLLGHWDEIRRATGPYLRGPARR